MCYTYFTVGPSGAGKTEFIQKFLEFEADRIIGDVVLFEKIVHQKFVSNFIEKQ